MSIRTVLSIVTMSMLFGLVGFTAPARAGTPDDPTGACVPAGPLTFAAPITTALPPAQDAIVSWPNPAGGWACGTCDQAEKDTCNEGKTPEGLTCKIFQNAGGICIDGDPRSACRIGGGSGCGFFCRLIGCPRFCRNAR